MYGGLYQSGWKFLCGQSYVKVIHVILIQLIFGFGNTFVVVLIGASPDASSEPLDGCLYLCDRYRSTYMYLYVPTGL